MKKSCSQEKTNQKNFLYRLIKTTAHELRSPLASINMANQAMQTILPKFFQHPAAAGEKAIQPSPSHTETQMLETAMSSIKKSTGDAQHFLSDLLTYIENYTADPETLPNISIQTYLSQFLKDYPFANAKERAVVKLDAQHDFAVKIPAVFIHDLLAGLLNKALLAIDPAQQGEICLWTETNNTANMLHFKYPCGKDKDQSLSHGFDALFTKQDDRLKAGLGFCQAAIQAFGGAITCEAEAYQTHIRIQFPMID